LPLGLKAFAAPFVAPCLILGGGAISDLGVGAMFDFGLALDPTLGGAIADF
jgi:hypothetical protein